MALDAVSKIEVLCHSARRRDVIAAMESFGRIHLVDLSQGSGDVPQEGFSPVSIDSEDLQQRIGNLENAIGFLRDLEVRSGRATVPDPGRTVPERELEAALRDTELLDTARRSWLVAMRIARLEGDEKELTQEKRFLQEWKTLPVPLETLREAAPCRLFAGVLEKGAVQAVETLAAANPLMHVETLEEGRDQRRVLIAVHHAGLKDILPALAENGFDPQDFGTRTGTVVGLLREVDEELDRVRCRREALLARAESCTGSLPRLEILSDAAGLLLARMRAAGAALETPRVSMIRAWVRASDLSGLRAVLDPLGEVSISVIEPEEGETPPSPLTERKPVQPYTMLTDMYGSPTWRDPDPTPLIAPFFALFFGICLGDAGYGITLALASGLGWAIMRKRNRPSRLFGILFQGGLAAIPIGLFLGAWFGADYSSLPALLRAPADLLNRLLPGFVPGQAGQEVFAVSKQFLYLTLALGIVQILAGVVVNLVKRLRDGQGLPAVLDQTGWLLATLGLFPWLFNHYLLDGALYDLEGPVDGIFSTMLLIGAVLIFLIGGREARGFGKVGLGAYAAYGIVNLLGDVLSYSRLFALSLSGGIIAQVVNQIAGMLRSQVGIPVVGFLLAVIVLAGGHLFNLAMGCLSGFIHTTRLQFVEYFTKFYEGTGVPFRPLRYQPRYTSIERDR